MFLLNYEVLILPPGAVTSQRSPESLLISIIQLTLKILRLTRSMMDRPSGTVHVKWTTKNEVSDPKRL